jgi:SAM-dependent methyltransferase
LGRQARLAIGARLGSRPVDGLGGTVHYNDRSLRSTSQADVAAYRREAAAVVDMIGRSLAEAGRDWADIGACLDVGCGYGRIVRELVHKLPSRAVSVCDVDEAAAEFTAVTFGVRRQPVVEMLPPNRNRAYDLIYVLDLYTEVDRPMIEMNLAKVADLARPGGIVLFTTRGAPEAGPVETVEDSDDDVAHLRAALDMDGFFHVPPSDETGRGKSWILASEMRFLVAATAPDLAFVSHRPREIDGLQDVFVYRKV